MNRNHLCYTFAAFLLAASCENVCAKTHECTREEHVVKTEAGNIDFHFTHNIKHPLAFHKIARIKDNAVELEDASRWTVSKIDIIKGWNSSHVTVTQNHAALSTQKFALLNTDLKLAIPASLAREAAPNKEQANYITTIDTANDILVLKGDKRWIVHSSDNSTLNKMEEHHRVIIGVNTGEGRDHSPYLIIDTANNVCVRASLLD
jgi:hypothetical protein